VLANRLLLTTKDRFIAVGHHVRNALIQFEGLRQDRVEVVHNGRDLRQFMPMQALRCLMRDELRIPQQAFVIVQVARLNRLKDHATAMRVMARLAHQLPNAVLLVVGDGEERDNILRIIRELNLTESVRMLGERNDVPKLLQAADTFLLSSISEGIPLTLIEAMATGLPCVSTRVGGVPEVIEDGESGLLADAGHDDDLAQHVLRLATQPELHRRVGCAARARVISRFDETAMHRTYRQLYRSMIASAPPRWAYNG
jgi:glycosyltransferase involved in cell wall biosynthesis